MDFWFLRRYFIVLTLVLILIPSVSHAEWTEWVTDLEAAYRFDDNINLTDVDSVKKDEHIFVPIISLGRYYQITDNMRLRITGDFSGAVHRNYYMLNSFESGVTLALSQKFGIGFDIPWVRIYVKQLYLAVRDANREGILLTTGFKIGKAINERLDIAVGYEFSYRQGNDGDTVIIDGKVFDNSVFDQSAHKGTFVLNYQLMDSLLASAGYEIRYGDIASTVGKGRVHGSEDEFDAIIHDNVYGIDGWWTYRVKVITHTLSFGLSYALTEHSSINANYSHVDGYDTNLRYENNLAGFSLMYAL
ncbi:MAG: hypothetical protein L3V56_13505 [Candidatus Magnetoovum sp. WYHC-5]|nr:hypothetical protein [Candidatus Magnetoovum sp. WYHC-5]